MSTVSAPSPELTVPPCAPTTAGAGAPPAAPPEPVLLHAIAAPIGSESKSEARVQAVFVVIERSSSGVSRSCDAKSRDR